MKQGTTIKWDGTTFEYVRPLASKVRCDGCQQGTRDSESRASHAVMMLPNTAKAEAVYWCDDCLSIASGQDQ